MQEYIIIRACSRWPLVSPSRHHRDKWRIRLGYRILVEAVIVVVVVAAVSTMFWSIPIFAYLKSNTEARMTFHNESCHD